MSNCFSKKIFVVEDSKIILKMIANELRSAGFENITEYQSSVEAFQDIAEDQLSDATIDLVITDLNMPELDGMQLITRLSEDDLTKELKIMVLTSEDDIKVKEEAFALGVEDYIVKPYEPEDFISRIQKVLEK